VNAIYVPMEITFSIKKLSVDIMDYIMDLIFFMDIIVSFRSIVFDPVTEEPITDFKRIAKIYILSGRFFIDLISCLPIEVIA
jgi:hypothetical protein